VAPDGSVVPGGALVLVPGWALGGADGIAVLETGKVGYKTSAMGNAHEKTWKDVLWIETMVWPVSAMTHATYRWRTILFIVSTENVNIARTKVISSVAMKNQLRLSGLRVSC
jgi:RNA polymerase subunit RPABC4/transcription elongation factor Spt4